MRLKAALQGALPPDTEDFYRFCHAFQRLPAKRFEFENFSATVTVYYILQELFQIVLELIRVCRFYLVVCINIYGSAGLLQLMVAVMMVMVMRHCWWVFLKLFRQRA